nr:hypothetical protein [Tanacetum cinerariifolium]
VLSLFRDQNNVEFRHREAWLFLKDKYKWTNPESTQARRTRGRVTGEDGPEMFGDDAIPRPSGALRKSKSQRSSASSSATSAARLAVVELQKRNEDLKILAFDATGMNPDDAAKIEALKKKTRAAPLKNNGHEVGLETGFVTGEDLGFHRGCFDVWNSVIRAEPASFSTRVQKKIKEMDELVC